MRYLIFLVTLLIANPAYSAILKCKVDFKWDNSTNTVSGHVDILLPDEFNKALTLFDENSENFEVIRNRVGKGLIEYAGQSHEVIFTNKGNNKDSSWIGFFLEAGYSNILTIETWKNNMPIFIYDGAAFKSDPSTGICHE